MAKATYRRKRFLASMMVPCGYKSVMAENHGSNQKSWQQEQELRTHILNHEHSIEGDNWE